MGLRTEAEEGAPRLLDLSQERIRTLHYTWIAFFISFYIWFNMAPLATTMLRDVGWLTEEHIKVLAIVNVVGSTIARESDGAPELLLMRRHHRSAFGGAYAFPGGVLEDDDALVDDHCAGITKDEADALLGVDQGLARLPEQCQRRTAKSPMGVPPAHEMAPICKESPPTVVGPPCGRVDEVPYRP